MNRFLALGQSPDLVILYEDKALLAVNKPAGLLFHGYTKGLPLPLVDQIKAEIQPYVGVVHRLDRPVSGVALFARSSKIAARLAAQFQDRSLDKIYLALVEGVPDQPRARLEDRLEAPPSSDRPSKGPQDCHLTYVTVKSEGGLSLLAIKLGTGRRHQIRMQLSRRGWPIVGDREYGAKTMLPGTEALDPRFCPLALHAARLRITHPQTGDELVIKAPLPFYWPSSFLFEAPDIADGPA